MTTKEITTDKIDNILGGLFTGEKTSSVMESPIEITEPCVFASYRDAAGELQYGVVVELSLANALGAALTMIPPGGAEDATTAGEVPENIGENLYEVLNIVSAVFADFHEHRVVLDKVATPGIELDSETSDRIANGECLIQIEYALERYMPGKMSFIKVS